LTLTNPLKEVDDYQSMDGALLRAAFEVAARLTTEDYEEGAIVRLTWGGRGSAPCGRRRAAPGDAGGDGRVGRPDREPGGMDRLRRDPLPPTSRRPAAGPCKGGRDGAVHGPLDVRDAGQWRTALQEFCGDGGLD